jgi:hypothetical protein
MKPDPNDRWKVRRTLVIFAVLLGVLMIIAGGFGLFQDRFTGELVYGGVTIITASLSAYTGFAAYDDKWSNGGSPDG